MFARASIVSTAACTAASCDVDKQYTRREPPIYETKKCLVRMGAREHGDIISSCSKAAHACDIPTMRILHDVVALAKSLSHLQLAVDADCDHARSLDVDVGRITESIRTLSNVLQQ